MSSVESEIREVEERLRKAELGPDPEVFDRLLDDDMVLVSEGQIMRPKAYIVEAHTPGKAQKIDRVDVRDMEIVDHGNVAVVSCTGDFHGPKGRFVFKFMRVWAKKADGWRIIAGSMFPVDVENLDSAENFNQTFPSKKL
jgi:hypothetical protein